MFKCISFISMLVVASFLLLSCSDDGAPADRKQDAGGEKDAPKKTPESAQSKGETERKPQEPARKDAPPPAPKPETPKPTPAPKAAALKPPPGEIWALIETNRGPIRLRLFADETPLTCANFINLARRGYYDGLMFHRVIERFMIQGGCPLGNGSGSPGYRFEDEIVPRLRHSKPGILSMANAGPTTNGSQFFITHVPTPHLDGKHTVFGEVIDDSDQGVVNEIVQGDRTLRITIEGDVSALMGEMKDRIDQWNAVLDRNFTHLRPAD